MSVAGVGAEPGQLAPAAAAALAAAEIPPSKLGPARRARLPAREGIGDADLAVTATVHLVA